MSAQIVWMDSNSNQKIVRGRDLSYVVILSFNHSQLTCMYGSVIAHIQQEHSTRLPPVIAIFRDEPCMRCKRYVKLVLLRINSRFKLKA